MGCIQGRGWEVTTIFIWLQSAHLPPWALDEGKDSQNVKTGMDYKGIIQPEAQRLVQGKWLAFEHTHTKNKCLNCTQNTVGIQMFLSSS